MPIASELYKQAHRLPRSSAQNHQTITHTHTQHIDNRNWSQHACNVAFANCLVKGNYPAEGKTIGGKFALCLHPSSDPLLIDMSPRCGGVCHLTRCQGSKIRPIFMTHGDSNANIATTTTTTTTDDRVRYEDVSKLFSRFGWKHKQFNSMPSPSTTPAHK